MSELDDFPPTRPWPQPVLDDIAALEARHGISLVSSEHAEILFDRMVMLEGEIVRLQAELSATLRRPTRLPRRSMV